MTATVTQLRIPTRIAPCCPNCGYTPSDDFAGEVMTVHFREREMKLIKCLIDAKGATRSMTQICQAIWGIGNYAMSESAAGNMRTLLCRINKKIRVVGWKIKVAGYMEGWRLVRTGE